MLVTFSCEEYENITMFGDVAKKLLSLMGHSAAIPGALVADDIPAALSNLKKGIEQDSSENSAENQQDYEDDEPPISLAHRAVPLIGMLEAAAKKKCSILWK
ncbi:hypothetical protein BN59_01375 [Legionella massiliensis]|uniref:DUF1840 domain-containing protein n=1 Tax=Legionella massiliensis TaxID=1034943 RepID=A0A078KZC4_9GAMM|nr:DUF1840 domain-containing protein [Legionella massiliensis]CDZ77093.1 hypothetical protein BN59_01375 [Legionella massiliensis]CEE12831.1 hypothetical protein BN1094_01375 [Legionella massiliensis]